VLHVKYIMNNFAIIVVFSYGIFMFWNEFDLKNGIKLMLIHGNKLIYQITIYCGGLKIVNH
jgi:hypothetical protein